MFTGRTAVAKDLEVEVIRDCPQVGGGGVLSSLLWCLVAGALLRRDTIPREIHMIWSAYPRKVWKYSDGPLSLVEGGYRKERDAEGNLIGKR